MQRLHPQALLLPHGAFCNSGYVAAHGFRLLEGMDLSLAIIIGNNHCCWNRLALCDQDWATPFGLVLADQVALKRMQEMCPSYEVKRLVHAAGAFDRESTTLSPTFAPEVSDSSDRCGCSEPRRRHADSLKRS